MDDQPPQTISPKIYDERGAKKRTIFKFFEAIVRIRIANVLQGKRHKIGMPFEDAHHLRFSVKNNPLTFSSGLLPDSINEATPTIATITL